MIFLPSFNFKKKVSSQLHHGPEAEPQRDARPEVVLARDQDRLRQDAQDRFQVKDGKIFYCPPNQYR